VNHSRSELLPGPRFAENEHVIVGSRRGGELVAECPRDGALTYESVGIRRTEGERRARLVQRRGQFGHPLVHYEEGGEVERQRVSGASDALRRLDSVVKEGAASDAPDAHCVGALRLEYQLPARNGRRLDGRSSLDLAGAAFMKLKRGRLAGACETATKPRRPIDGRDLTRPRRSVQEPRDHEV
jgi:hypothetical protein